jgi:hypothetical protein
MGPAVAAVIGLALDDNGLQVNLQNAPGVTGLQLQKWMDRVIKHVQAALLRNIAKGGLVGRRTGNLARAIMSLVTITGDAKILGEIWPDLDKAPYGDIQETGGTIVPKSARALTIPLDAMLTGNGVARGTAKQVFADPEAYGFLRVFIPKGKAVIMGLRDDHHPIPLFALAQSVTIPATHYLSNTLEQEMGWIQSALEDLTGDIVQVAMTGSAASA